MYIFCLSSIYLFLGPEDRDDVNDDARDGEGEGEDADGEEVRVHRERRKHRGGVHRRHLQEGGKLVQNWSEYQILGDIQALSARSGKLVQAFPLSVTPVTVTQ